MFKAEKHPQQLQDTNTKASQKVNPYRTVLHKEQK